MGTVAALVILLASAPQTALAAAGSPRLDFSAVADGGGRQGEVDLADADENNPLVLWPGENLRLHLEVQNPGPSAVTVGAVRLHGQVLNLTFFDTEATVALTVPPGATEELTLNLPVRRLQDQAAGWLPAGLELYDGEGELLAEQSLAVDVRGSVWSTYVIFALLVAVATGLLLSAALLRLALGRLPRSRWYRAVRFAVPGVGLGLTLTFTLSVLRVDVPSAENWAVTVAAGGLLGLVAGFLTPAPVPPPSRRVIDLDLGISYPADHAPDAVDQPATADEGVSEASDDTGAHRLEGAPGTPVALRRAGEPTADAAPAREPVVHPQGGPARDLPPDGAERMVPHRDASR